MSSDPHLQSLLARGSTLISGQSSALDQSRAKLDSLLSALHHWKSTRISSIEADHASQQRALVERFGPEEQAQRPSSVQTIDALAEDSMMHLQSCGRCRVMLCDGREMQDEEQLRRC